MDRDPDNFHCIVAANDIAELIESHLPMVLEAVAKELESHGDDMQWRLEHSRKAAFHAEGVVRHVRDFIKTMKEDESV